MLRGVYAIEAMIAAAATIAVVYPHMNSIGGDSFLLIHLPERRPARSMRRSRRPSRLDRTGIASTASRYDPLPRGLAANTLQERYRLGRRTRASRRALRGRMPLSRLLADAIYYADQGCAGIARQKRYGKEAESCVPSRYAKTFLDRGKFRRPVLVRAETPR